ncbi:MAG: hypothetical protein R2749_18470 [Acidimicrobiales bacterium]
MPASVIDPELRARLNLAKLRALVRAHTGADDARSARWAHCPPYWPVPTATCWRRTAPASAPPWRGPAARQLAGTLHVFADAVPEDGAPESSEVGVLARRATLFGPLHAAVTEGHRRPGAARPHRPIAGPWRRARRHRTTAGRRG